MVKTNPTTFLQRFILDTMRIAIHYRSKGLDQISLLVPFDIIEPLEKRASLKFKVSKDKKPRDYRFNLFVDLLKRERGYDVFPSSERIFGLPREFFVRGTFNGNALFNGSDIGTERTKLIVYCNGLLHGVSNFNDGGLRLPFEPEEVYIETRTPNYKKPNTYLIDEINRPKTNKIKTT